MVSMKDIALRCGVSVGTVSKALNGRDDVGEATKQQILSVAKELGYTVNAAARALKTNRTYNIGIVFTDLAGSGFMHEYFASMLNSFRQEAERRGRSRQKGQVRSIADDFGTGQQMRGIRRIQNEITVAEQIGLQFIKAYVTLQADPIQACILQTIGHKKTD